MFLSQKVSNIFMEPASQAWDDKLMKLVQRSTQPSFTIIHNSKKYQVRTVIAAARSMKIRQLLTEDALCDSYKMTADSGPFKFIASFLNGEETNVPNDAVLSSLDAANELRIEEMISELSPRAAGLLRHNNVLHLFQRAWNFGAPCTIFADYIAQNWDEFESKMLELDDDMIDFIMRSNWFGASDDAIRTFIRARLASNTSNPARLLKYLPLREAMQLPGFDANMYREALEGVAAPYGAEHV